MLRTASTTASTASEGLLEFLSLPRSCSALSSLRRDITCFLLSLKYPSKVTFSGVRTVCDSSMPLTLIRKSPWSSSEKEISLGDHASFNAATTSATKADGGFHLPNNFCANAASAFGHLSSKVAFLAAESHLRMYACTGSETHVALLPWPSRRSAMRTGWDKSAEVATPKRICLPPTSPRKKVALLAFTLSTNSRETS